MPTRSTPGGSVVGQRVLQNLQVFQRHARTDCYACERVVGNEARDSGHLGEKFVYVAEKCSATRHYHAAVNDVGRQFGGCSLEHAADSAKMGPDSAEEM